MNLEYVGMPRDFYKNYIENIQAVTKDDVLRVAKEYLHPDKMTYMVVGKTSEFADQLKEFGEINFIELEEPIVDAEM
jgi:predicted Zn-dependent peptidase